MECPQKLSSVCGAEASGFFASPQVISHPSVPVRNSYLLLCSVPVRFSFVKDIVMASMGTIDSQSSSSHISSTARATQKSCIRPSAAAVIKNLCTAHLDTCKLHLELLGVRIFTKTGLTPHARHSSSLINTAQYHPIRTLPRYQPGPESDEPPLSFNHWPVHPISALEAANMLICSPGF